MSSFMPWHRVRRERIASVLDAETAAKYRWAEADARCDERRDHELFAADNHTTKYGNDEKLPAKTSASLLG